MYKIFSLSYHLKIVGKIKSTVINSYGNFTKFHDYAINRTPRPSFITHEIQPRFNVSYWPTRCVSRFVRTSWLEKHARPGIAPRVSVHGTSYRVYSRNNAKLLCEARNSTSREQCRRVEVGLARIYKVIQE